MAVRQGREADEFAAEPRSLDLRDYWAVVRRRWRLVVAGVVVGVVGAGGYAVVKSPSYTATAQVVVYPVTQGQPGQAAPSFPGVNMSTEETIAQSAPVSQQAAKTLGVPYAKLAKTVGKRLSVVVPASTLTTSNVLQINWEADSPALAQRGANAFANAYLTVRRQLLAGQLAVQVSTIQKSYNELETDIAQVDAQISKTPTGPTRKVLLVRLTELTSQANSASGDLATMATYNDQGGVVIGAALPTKASGFGRSVIAVIGLVFGLLVGLGLALVRDVFDDRVRDVTQLERRLGAVTLGELPPAGASDDRRRGVGKSQALPAIMTAASPDSRAANAARAMRATVVAVAARRNWRVLLVVAADSSMSAGRVVAELGVALAESGRHILLVASDIRGSILPQIFDVPEETGLSEFLLKGGDPEATTWRPWQASGAPLPAELAESLAVLPTGQRSISALSILDSRRMADLLAAQRMAHDFVLLDAPPATAADVLSLASHVDGVIVLARKGQTAGKDVEALRNRLDQVGVPVVGGVLIGGEGLSRRERMAVQPAAVKSRPSVERPKPAAAPAPSRAAQLGPAAPPPPTLPLPKVATDTERSAAAHGTLERPL